MKKKNVLVVGAGFAGAVAARELAGRFGWRVTIIEARPHIGGNCFTRRDPETNVTEHVYGPHIFNTNHDDVYQYVAGLTEWCSYTNRVKATNSKGVFSMPINLHTINQFFGRSMSPTDARSFIAKQAINLGRPAQNFEEQALSMIGPELYNAFIYGYTKKQWGCEPCMLPAEIIKRLPVRFDYNDNFYASRVQLMPKYGYTPIFDRLLNHRLIELNLGVRFSSSMLADYDHCIYTGCIDEFFGFTCGRLGYRTVEFARTVVAGDFQGCAVMNYTEESPTHTRIHEHKHFAPWEAHDRSLVLTEMSRETGESDVPFYPKRLAADMEKLQKYLDLAHGLSNISFLGRLGAYRYLDMDLVIGEALDFVDMVAAQGGRLPVCSPSRRK